MSEEATLKQKAIQALGKIDFIAGQLEALDYARIRINDEPIIQFKEGALRSFSKEIWECANIIRKALASE